MRVSTARTVSAVDTAPVYTAAVAASRRRPHLTTAILAAIPFALVILALQTKYLSHLHSSPFFDFPIEIQELPAQLSSRCFADRRFPDAGKSNENQMRR